MKLIKFIKNYILLDQIIVSFFNFLNVIFLSRFLNIIDFGNYSGMFVVFLFICSIQQAIFISPIYTLETNLNDKETLCRINDMRTIYLLFIIIFCFIFLIFSGLVSEIISITINSSAFTLMLFFYLNNDFNRRILIKLSMFKKTLLYDLIIYPLFFLVIVFLEFYNNLNINMIIYSYCFLSFFASIILISKFRIPLKIKYINFFILKKYWNFSKWISYSTICQFISGNLFSIVASSQIGTSVYAILRVYQSVSGLFNVFLQFIDTQVSLDLPKIYNKKGLMSSYNYVFKIIWFVVVILFFVFLGALLLGHDKIIHLIFGAKYVDYSYFINFIFLLFVVNLINVLLRNLFRVFNKTSKILITNLISSIAVLFSISYIIQVFGISGVYVGTIMAQLILIITSVLIIYFGKSNFKINNGR